MALPFTLSLLTLLLAAAWRDLATRTIPDSVSVLIAVTGLVVRALEGPLALVLSIGTAVLLLTILLVIYAKDMIGGGDVKILAALAFALPPLDTYRLVVATALAGGFLAIAYLLLGHQLRRTPGPAPKSSLGRVLAIESWRVRHRGPLPYGLAIAAGGTFVLLFPGSF